MTFVQTHSDQKKKVTPAEGGYCGKHICFKCGRPFPNPHPSAKQRRAHKKVCGKIEGYEPKNLKGKNEVSFSTSYELCSPETQKPYDSHNANAGMVTNTTTFVHDDAEVNQIMELTEEDNARDHEEIKTGKYDLAKYESKEEAIPPNLVLENATLVRESSFGPVDVEVNNQTTKFIGGDNPGDHERDKIEKYDSAKNESKEGAISPNLLLENATFNQRTKLVGGDNASDYEKNNIEKCNIAGSESKKGSIEAYKIPLSGSESARNLGQTEPKHYTSSVSEIEVLMEDEMIESKRNLGQTEPYQYKSSLSEIEDGKCDSARNLQTTGSKHLGNIRETGSSKENPQNNYFQERIEEFEFYENCEIQEECAEESSTAAKLSHAGAAELLQNTSQKLTLKDILNFQVEGESSSQNATAVIGNSYESSGYEGFSSQQNALSDVDADALAPTDSYTSSQDKKANMKNPKAATDQYFDDALNDYERRTCRPLFDLRSGDVVVEKPRWRKKIAGIFAKFGLQKKEKNLPGGLLGEIDLKSVLKEHSQSERKMSKIERKPHLRQLSCCSSPRVNLSHKRKAKEWELQLQKYISENSLDWVRK